MNALQIVNKAAVTGLAWF